MRWELYLSTKFLTAKKRYALISFISIISITGIAIGVAALIAVLSVMSGFDNELKEKIIGINSHIVVEKEEGIQDYRALLGELKKIDGIASAATFINAQALIVGETRTAGIIVRGIDPNLEKNVTKLNSYIKDGEFKLQEGDIIVGTELAKRFRVGLGDNISLVSPASKKTYVFTIKAQFNSGMYDYDSNIAFISIPDAQRIFNLPDIVGGVELKVKDETNIEKIKREIEAKFGSNYLIRTWMETNRNLFSALKLEKIIMFVILTLIVIVAALNIASSLVMTVMEKTKDIGILRSLGATKKSIMAIFAISGTFVGFIGTFIGIILGILLSYLIEKYQFVHIPKDIYYIDRIPVQVIPSDVFIIGISSLLISFFATLYPAIKASGLNITDALRYE